VAIPIAFLFLSPEQAEGMVQGPLSFIACRSAKSEQHTNGALLGDDSTKAGKRKLAKQQLTTRL
jgi:hypothetical protein